MKTRRSEAQKVRKPLKRLDPYRWEVPIDYTDGMRVPGVIYADDKLMADIEGDDVVDQVANAATLPGIVGRSIAMPDIHFGYGLPIGGVIATDPEADGVITPGGVGFDINCGVRLMTTNLKHEDIKEHMRPLVEDLFRSLPSGIGSKGKITLSPSDAKQLVTKGARWMVEHGFGTENDLDHTESGGALDGGDTEAISKKAFERGRKQLGTLGSGNHFAEIQIVDEIYEPSVAEAFGLWEGQITLMIHSGSRGFGHQICTDYLVVMEQALRKYDIHLPDKQLACAPYHSPEGQDYLGAMIGAANYAWANRQAMTHWAREAFQRTLGMGPRDLGMDLLYDVAHNIVKLEEHTHEGEQRHLMVHRKGATRAFPKGHPEVPDAFRHVGQPVLIPGDMGRYSFILVGTPEAMGECWGSSCHGAGRVMSRKAATRLAKGRSIFREMEDKGILLRAAGRRTVVEEISEAYKDVSDVVRVVQGAGIAKTVAKVRPLGVVKG
ncbi:MAG: RtcB family protein [bacterium]